MLFSCTETKPVLDLNCMMPFIHVYGVIHFGSKKGLAPVFMWQNVFVKHLFDKSLGHRCKFYGSLEMSRVTEGVARWETLNGNRSKFVVFYRLWWRLHMSEIYSNGTYKQIDICGPFFPRWVWSNMSPTSPIDSFSPGSRPSCGSRKCHEVQRLYGTNQRKLQFASYTFTVHQSFLRKAGSC